MKALVVTENGGPDRLKIMDWPEPRPAPGGASRAFVGLSILGLASQRPDLINAVTREALGLLESGTVAFPQLEVVNLDDVAEIHSRIERRSLTGKVVARI